MNIKYTPYHNRQVAYQQEGRGPAVIFLHGFLENQMLWEDFTKDLLEEGYRVITIDLPGFGRSEPGAEASIDYYAEAVRAVVNAANINDPVLVGHSMGGYTALAYARKYADDLRGLALFHSHPYADSEEKKQDREKQIAFIQKHGHEIYVKQVIPKFFAEGYASKSTFDVDKMIHRASRGPVQGIVDALHAMIARPDSSEVLREADYPVLFLIGQEDHTAPASYFQDMLPLPSRAHIHTLERVGHMGMIEARSKTQFLLRKFVEFCNTL